ncbi:hypothetical protein GCG21_08900 [Pseudactinotalea sp. HY160]|uniref:hypothetical protein n=1 Tax=Pseudactinotalea sp. HY160 TaxID=2654490 RepID=UPI00128E3B10|nr:hypothetical protein [Pseudactinotalea sp. HY160]MPV50122.1 hypothetical protein [Pseudactinotalea sp. HY160]
MNSHIITVDIDGHVASWDGHDFTGDPELVREARAATIEGRTVDIFGFFPVEASAGDPVQALAALAAWNPGRLFVTQAPAEVASWLDEAFSNRACVPGEANPSS